MQSDPASFGEVTLLLRRMTAGDGGALHLLIERVYQELKSLAVGKLRTERPQHLLGATALVNEAYLRMLGGNEPVSFDNRRHFFSAASETMRRILVDSARQRLAKKRGGGMRSHDVAEIAIASDTPDEELIDLDQVLSEFAVLDPAKAELVKLRYFVGLSEAEAAEALGISRATASRHWAFARAWLYARLKRNDSHSE